MVELRGMSTFMSPPKVSSPRESGVTSRSVMCSRLPEEHGPLDGRSKSDGLIGMLSHVERGALARGNLDPAGCFPWSLQNPNTGRSRSPVLEPWACGSGLQPIRLDPALGTLRWHHEGLASNILVCGRSMELPISPGSHDERNLV